VQKSDASRVGSKEAMENEANVRTRGKIVARCMSKVVLRLSEERIVVVDLARNMRPEAPLYIHLGGNLNPI
jgi:hypothetical protein